jgi:hypothetical protein
MGFNKRHFQELKAVLTGYKTDINKIISETKVNEELKKIYSQDYFEQLVKTQQDNAIRLMNEKREAARTRVNTIIKNLRNDVAEWVNADIDINLLNKLNVIRSSIAQNNTAASSVTGVDYIKLLAEQAGNTVFGTQNTANSTSGIKLSSVDVELLAEKAAGQYLPLKILSEIAEANGIKLNVPSAEKYMKEIKEIENGSNTLLNTYCGPDAEGRNLLPHNIIKNVNYGRYEIWQCMNADYILRPENAIEKAESNWGNTMAHIEEKTSLTGEEENYISGLYKGHEGNTANRTKELVVINPKLREIIELSKYAEFLPAAEK